MTPMPEPDYDKELQKLNREQATNQMADVYIDAMAQALDLPEEKRESLRAAMRDLMARQAEPLDYGKIIETQFHAAQRLQMGPSDTFTEFVWAEGDNDDGLERQSTNITRVLQHCVRMSVFSGGRRIICEGFAGSIELQGAEAADLLAIYKTVRPNSLLFKPIEEAISNRGAGSIAESGVVVEPARPGERPSLKAKHAFEPIPGFEPEGSQTRIRICVHCDQPPEAEIHSI